MDGLRHPVGSQPPNVYWKRRLAVLVGVVVAALLLWWIVSVLTSGSSTPGTTTSPEATTSSSTSSTAVADPSRACTSEDFTVAAVAPATVAASKAPTFTVTVTSVASSPCVIDPTKDSKISIRSGDDHWFDSSKCTDYNVYNAEEFMLDTGADHELTASWNYGRDDAGCSGDLVAAKAGTYRVTATVAGVSAKEQPFSVTD